MRGTVQSGKSGVDGMYEIKLDTSPYLYVDIEPMYGLAAPAVGSNVTLHGIVRWDDGHKEWRVPARGFRPDQSLVLR